MPFGPTRTSGCSPHTALAMYRAVMALGLWVYEFIINDTHVNVGLKLPSGCRSGGRFFDISSMISTGRTENKLLGLTDDSKLLADDTHRQLGRRASRTGLEFQMVWQDGEEVEAERMNFISN